MPYKEAGGLTVVDQTAVLHSPAVLRKPRRIMVVTSERLRDEVELVVKGLYTDTQNDVEPGTLGHLPNRQGRASDASKTIDDIPL